MELTPRGRQETFCICLTCFEYLQTSDDTRPRITDRQKRTQGLYRAKGKVGQSVWQNLAAGTLDTAGIVTLVH